MLPVVLGGNLPHLDRLSRCYLFLTLFPFSSFSSVSGVGGVSPEVLQHDKKRSWETYCKITPLEKQMCIWYSTDTVLKEPIVNYFKFFKYCVTLHRIELLMEMR